MRFKPKTPCDAPAPCTSEKHGQNRLEMGLIWQIFGCGKPKRTMVLDVSKHLLTHKSLPKPPVVGFLGQTPVVGFLGQPPLRGFLEKNRLTLPCEIFREKSATLPISLLSNRFCVYQLLLRHQASRIYYRGEPFFGFVSCGLS